MDVLLQRGVQVLCDRECLKDVEAVAEASGREDYEISQQQCNGPWYCSRTEICELYRKESRDPLAAFERSCTVVYGCANHSQCFPSSEDQSRMNIQFSDAVDPNEIRDEGFTVRYGGVTMRTTCCVNNRGPQLRYRLFISQPCNAAVSRDGAVALFVAAAAAIIMFGLTLAP